MCTKCTPVFPEIFRGKPKTSYGIPGKCGGSKFRENVPCVQFCKTQNFCVHILHKFVHKFFRNFLTNFLHKMCMQIHPYHQDGLHCLRLETGFFSKIIPVFSKKFPEKLLHFSGKFPEKFSDFRKIFAKTFSKIVKKCAKISVRTFPENPRFTPVQRTFAKNPGVHKNVIFGKFAQNFVRIFLENYRLKNQRFQAQLTDFCTWIFLQNVVCKMCTLFWFLSIAH